MHVHVRVPMTINVGHELLHPPVSTPAAAASPYAGRAGATRAGRAPLPRAGGRRSSAYMWARHSPAAGLPYARETDVDGVKWVDPVRSFLTGSMDPFTWNILLRDKFNAIYVYSRVWFISMKLL